MSLGFSVLPLRGKIPHLTEWEPYQRRPATQAEIDDWVRRGVLENVGIACGLVSGNLIVIDLDGKEAYRTFCHRFPFLSRTYTVRTGSGTGYQLYLYCADLPASTRVLDTPLGNIELLSTGKQVAAPPSTHPTTQRPYTVHRQQPILRIPSLAHVVVWIQDFNLPEPGGQPDGTVGVPSQAPHTHPATGDPAEINPALIETLTRYFRRLGYRQNREWLNGQCVYPERHKHADHKPSFGFNTVSGWGNCFWCGPILTKDICARTGIDPETYGGLVVHRPPAAQLPIKELLTSHDSS